MKKTIRVKLEYADGAPPFETTISSNFGDLGLLPKLQREVWPLLARDWTRLRRIEITRE